MVCCGSVGAFSLMEESTNFFLVSLKASRLIANPVLYVLRLMITSRN